MSGVTTIESAVLERCADEPMLAQVEAWAAINSGSAHLEGLACMAETLADAFSSLPGELVLFEPEPVQGVGADGALLTLGHGSNLHLTVRPEAPVQLLLTGHMDTVYGKEHPFQATHWREPGVLGGPGVADMKGGLALMLAALKAIEASPAAATVGYEVVINSDEEVGSPGSAALLRQAARGKRVGLTYEPAQAAAISRSSSGDAAPMPAVTRKTAAMPSSLPRIWRCGWQMLPGRDSPSIRRASTVAARTMWCPTVRCFGSTSGRLPPRISVTRKN
jgi:hypothetical protein